MKTLIKIIRMIQQIPTKERCPRCNNNEMITDSESGEVFCGACGFVLSEKLEEAGPEWRSFTDDKTNKARTGNATSLTRHDQGLTTVIGLANRDSAGKPLSSSMKSSIKRLRIWNDRSRVSGNEERNLQHAFTELQKMKDKLALSDSIIEKTAYIYRKALEKKLIRGRSISALIAATLYAACRESGTPRTLKDISQVADVRKRNVAICYRMLLKELDLRMPVTDSVQCVARIASKAGLSEKIKRHAIKILKKAQQHNVLAGKDPMGIAASALYLSTLKLGAKNSQKEIAFAAGVTEVTVRNRCRGLRSLNLS